MSLIQIKKPVNQVIEIEINRPDKRNALNYELTVELLTCFEKLCNDDQFKIILLRASGDHFCAGADISEMKNAINLSDDENLEQTTVLANLLNIIYHCPFPIVTLVQGRTLGGGLGLIACSDIIIAEQNATFCFSEARIGLAPYVISPYIIKVLGEHQAKFYFLTANTFNVQTAMQMNLINYSVNYPDLYTEGLNCCENLLKNSPHALLEVKKLFKEVSYTPLNKTWLLETANHLAITRRHPQAREGLDAFLNKRSPKWS